MIFSGSDESESFFACRVESLQRIIESRILWALQVRAITDFGITCFGLVFCHFLRVQKTIHSDEHVALRELLVAKRRERELTQTALAEKLGVPQSVVSKVERGERLLDVIEFARYVSALGDDPVRVFSELVRDSKVLDPAKTAKTSKRQSESRR